MCTVTLIPTGPASYILTSNRDEAPARATTQFPSYRTSLGSLLLFPRDEGAGGTWICTSDTGLSICLLNGAFQPHHRTPPYRISRGIMLLEAMECIRPEEFISNYMFDGIEPFTMIFTDIQDGSIVAHELRWDGEQKHVSDIDTTKNHLWASATLYDAGSVMKRKERFEQHVSMPAGVEDVLSFHLLDHDNRHSDSIVMDRGFVKTLSVTSLSVDTRRTHMIYKDVNPLKTYEFTLAHQPARS